MKVLVTGNLGYIGTVLTEVLKSDYDVVGFDAGFFSECNLVETQSLNKQIIKDKVYYL